MGRHDNLTIRIQVEHQLDEPVLPFDMQGYFGFVQKKHRGTILHQEEREEEQQNLLLTRRKLLHIDDLASLAEDDTVLVVDINRLSSHQEKRIDEVKELVYPLLLMHGSSQVLQHAQTIVGEAEHLRIALIKHLVERQTKLRQRGLLRSRNVKRIDIIEARLRIVSAEGRFMNHLLSIAIHFANRTLARFPIGYLGIDMHLGLQLTDDLVVLHQHGTNKIQHGCLAETILSHHDIDIRIEVVPFERGITPHGVDNDIFDVNHIVSRVSERNWEMMEDSG